MVEYARSVLIYDPDPESRRLIRDALQEEGILGERVFARTLREARHMIATRETPFSLIISSLGSNPGPVSEWILGLREPSSPYEQIPVCVYTAHGIYSATAQSLMSHNVEVISKLGQGIHVLTSKAKGVMKRNG